jgi:hypothetical protein
MSGATIDNKDDNDNSDDWFLFSLLLGKKRTFKKIVAAD